MATERYTSYVELKSEMQLNKQAWSLCHQHNASRLLVKDPTTTFLCNKSPNQNRNPRNRDHYRFLMVNNQRSLFGCIHRNGNCKTEKNRNATIPFVVIPCDAGIS